MTVNRHDPAAPTIEIGLGAVLTYNGLTMHDRIAGADCYLIQRIDGLGVPDIRDARDVNPSDHGETAFSSFFGGRNIVLDGTIIAGNMAKLRGMINDLKGAFGILAESALVFEGATGYGFEDAWLNCRLTALAIPEVQENMLPRRPFQVTLRASDPFIKAVIGLDATQLYSDVTQLARVYDRTYTLTYGTYVDASGTPTTPNPFLVVNRGNYAARPTFRITGPVTNPSITNSTNGQSLTINGSIADADYFEIDIGRRTMVDSFGNNQFSLLDSGSDWILINPGSNTLTLASSSFTSPASVRIVFNSTWL